MCNPAAIAIVGTVGALTSGVSSYQTGQATAKADEYQANIYKQNAATATQNAINTRQTGIENAQKVQLETAQKVSSQTAAMAANGIVSNSGTASELTAGTEQLGQMDALTTMDNANREAYNYDRQANDYTTQSNLSLLSANNAKNTGLLSALGSTLTGVSSAWSPSK